MCSEASCYFRGVILLYSLAALNCFWKGWMEEMADALGLEVVVTLLFLRESFLMFHSYPAWAQLDGLHGKCVNQILHLWMNPNMYPGIGTSRRGTWTLGTSTGQTGGLQVSCSTSKASRVDRLIWFLHKFCQRQAEKFLEK